MENPDPKTPLPPDSDGCTMFPDGDWEPCCEVHDRDYWRGGSESHRKRADRALRECIHKVGRRKGPEARIAYWLLGWLMYAGVRIFGSPHFSDRVKPRKLRWGAGQPHHLRGYPEKRRTYER